jgi:peptide/nickel transport system permease protein
MKKSFKKFLLKVWQLIFLLAVILILLRINIIWQTVVLAVKYFSLLFNNFNDAYNQFSFNLFDQFFSVTFLLTLPFIVFLFRDKGFLRIKLNFSWIIITLLFFFFLFAPIITNWNPEFQKDIGVTKLLPPFSKVNIISLKTKQNYPQSSLGNFLEQRDKVLKKSYNEQMVFVDSIGTLDNDKHAVNDVFLFQGNEKTKINKANLILENGIPVIHSKIFLLGTDEFGRDIFSRIVYGTRISLFVGLGAVIISFLLGVLLGFFAGYFGGFTNITLSRFTDMFLAFPILFLIILILALFGNSIWTIIAVLGFTSWMGLFKVVRGEVISLKNKEFLITSQMLGLSKRDIIFKEILPLILAPVIVNLVFQYGSVILAEAALSYLGLGTGAGYPSWGAMIEAGQSYLTKAWWMIFSPSLILFLTLFAANNIGKNINEFLNPRLKND